MIAQSRIPQVLAGMLGMLVAAASAAAQQSAAPSTPAAIVNGEVISIADVDAVLRLVPAPPTPPTEEQRRQMRRDAVEMLIDDTLVRQFLARNARAVAAGEVDTRLAELKTALKAQKRTLPDFLAETAQTEAHLRLDIQKKIQWDEFVKGQTNEPNLRRYYDEFRDFYDQVNVRASHILIRVSPGAGPADGEAARARLQALRQQIAAGQLDFADAARKYSQCTSAPQGGDIGYFSRKWAVDERIARAAFAMKPGEVSDVIQTDYGFHLIKVTDRKPGQPSTFEKVRDTVRENYAMDLWQTVVTEQRRTARIDIRIP